MKRLGWMLLLMLTPALVAQEPGDSGAAPPANGVEAQQLRKQIRQRWNEHVRSTLGLTDDQTAKLQATEERFEGQRQPIRARQREINQALNAELASGTPNQDRVKQLINERQDNQLKLQQVNRDEAREMQVSSRRCSMRGIRRSVAGSRSAWPKSSGSGASSGAKCSGPAPIRGNVPGAEALTASARRPSPRLAARSRGPGPSLPPTAASPLPRTRAMTSRTRRWRTPCRNAGSA